MKYLNQVHVPLLDLPKILHLSLVNILVIYRKERKEITNNIIQRTKELLGHASIRLFIVFLYDR